LHKDGGDWNVPNRVSIGWNDRDDCKFYHNGGTLTVAEQFRVSSQAGSSGEFTMNGGIINANGKAVTIPAAIGADGDTGGMTYKGGGAVTLSAAPAYSGKTTIELGTALVIPAAIAGADLEVVIPDGLASGLYKVVAVFGNGAFASDVLSTATLPVTLPSDENVRFFLDNGDTEIWCAYSSDANELMPTCAEQWVLV